MIKNLTEKHLLELENILGDNYENTLSSIFGTYMTKEKFLEEVLSGERNKNIDNMFKRFCQLNPYLIKKLMIVFECKYDTISIGNLKGDTEKINSLVATIDKLERAIRTFHEKQDLCINDFKISDNWKKNTGAKLKNGEELYIPYEGNENSVYNLKNIALEILNKSLYKSKLKLKGLINRFNEVHNYYLKGEKQL